MGLTQWMVLIAGVLAIVWINWYFLFSRGNEGRARAAGDVQEVTVQVRGGYSPDTIHLTSGQRARLIFDRQETSGCSEEVVLPDFGVRKFLPAFEQTPVEFTPKAPGTFEFTCGMGMLRGRLVIQ